MIDEIDEAIRQLLSKELPIRNSEIDIAFDMPKREWSARLSRPTLNLYLYDVRENVKMRQMTTAWESSSNGGTATTRPGCPRSNPARPRAERAPPSLWSPPSQSRLSRILSSHHCANRNLVYNDALCGCRLPACRQVRDPHRRSTISPGGDLSPIQ